MPPRYTRFRGSGGAAEVSKRLPSMPASTDCPVQMASDVLALTKDYAA